MERNHLTIALFLLSLGTTIPALAADGQLDPAFGVGGATHMSWDVGGNLDDRVTGVVADEASGHLFVIGTFDSSSGDTDWGVAEIDQIGNLSNSQYFVFNLGGTNTDVPTGVALDGAGGLLISGYVQTASSFEIRFCRLRTSDLGLDTTFAGGTGCAAYAFPAPLEPVALARAGDGGWLIAGSLDWGVFDRDFFVVKFTATGILDASFNALDPFHPGMVVVPIDLVTQGSDEAHAMAVDHAGRVLVVGQSQMALNSWAASAIRITPSGQLDMSFGGGGIRWWNFVDSAGAHLTAATSVAVDPTLDGIVIGDLHLTQTPSEVGAEIAHFDAFGAWQSFPGSASPVRDVTWLSGVVNNLASVQYQSDGKIVAVGDSTTAHVWAATRLLPDGSVDPAWGSGGLAAFSPADQGWGTSMGVVAAGFWSGKLAVAGTVANPNQDWLVARFTNALVFSDGFESGDRSRWSGGVP